jgi:hypothetical protein
MKMVRPYIMNGNLMLSDMEINEVWERAEKDAQKDFFFAHPNFDKEFIGHNPYIEGTDKYEEYECAYEHYIMSYLGY